MNTLRSIVTCLAIASLLVSDVVVAVHRVSCSHGALAARSASHSGGEQANAALHCCCLHHGGPLGNDNQAASKQVSSEQALTHADGANSVSPDKQNEHDSDQCTICRGALICRFALICDVAMPLTSDLLPSWVTPPEVTMALGHQSSSALSQRGPPV